MKILLGGATVWSGVHILLVNVVFSHKYKTNPNTPTPLRNFWRVTFPEHLLAAMSRYIRSGRGTITFYKPFLKEKYFCKYLFFSRRGEHAVCVAVVGHWCSSSQLWWVDHFSLISINNVILWYVISLFYFSFVLQHIEQ